jgi:uncharacterized membrane protein
MAYIEQQVDIDAPPDVVWAVMADVERWPEWTPSTRSVRLLDGGELRNTVRARVRLQGLAPSTWRVTEFDAGRAFTWDTQAMPGLRMAARHAVEPRADGSRVTLSITSTGALARVTASMIGAMSRRGMRLEAAGLKRRAEERARTPGASG